MNSKIGELQEPHQEESFESDTDLSLKQNENEAILDQHGIPTPFNDANKTVLQDLEGLSILDSSEEENQNNQNQKGTANNNEKSAEVLIQEKVDNFKEAEKTSKTQKFEALMQKYVSHKAELKSLRNNSKKQEEDIRVLKEKVNKYKDKIEDSKIERDNLQLQLQQAHNNYKKKKIDYDELQHYSFSLVSALKHQDHIIKQLVSQSQNALRNAVYSSNGLHNGYQNNLTLPSNDIQKNGSMKSATSAQKPPSSQTLKGPNNSKVVEKGRNKFASLLSKKKWSKGNQESDTTVQQKFNGFIYPASNNGSIVDSKQQFSSSPSANVQLEAKEKDKILDSLNLDLKKCAKGSSLDQLLSPKTLKFYEVVLSNDFQNGNLSGFNGNNNSYANGQNGYHRSSGEISKQKSEAKLNQTKSEGANGILRDKPKLQTPPPKGGSPSTKAKKTQFANQINSDSEPRGFTKQNSDSKLLRQKSNTTTSKSRIGEPMSKQGSHRNQSSISFMERGYSQPQGSRQVNFKGLPSQSSLQRGELFNLHSKPNLNSLKSVRQTEYMKPKPNFEFQKAPKFPAENSKSRQEKALRLQSMPVNGAYTQSETANSRYNPQVAEQSLQQQHSQVTLSLVSEPETVMLQPKDQVPQNVLDQKLNQLQQLESQYPQKNQYQQDGQQLNGKKSKYKETVRKDANTQSTLKAYDRFLGSGLTFGGNGNNLMNRNQRKTYSGSILPALEYSRPRSASFQHPNPKYQIYTQPHSFAGQSMQQNNSFTYSSNSQGRIHGSGKHGSYTQASSPRHFPGTQRPQRYKSRRQKSSQDMQGSIQNEALYSHNLSYSNYNPNGAQFKTVRAPAQNPNGAQYKTVRGPAQNQNPNHYNQGQQTQPQPYNMQYEQTQVPPQFGVNSGPNSFSTPGMQDIQSYPIGIQHNSYAGQSFQGQQMQQEITWRH